MKNQEITVLITHYNSEKYLSRAVGSILDQTITSLKLIIIDDNSYGNLWLDSLREYKNDKRITLYKTNKNVGCFRIKNQIIPKIDSKYIAFQDADDFSEKNRLELQYKTLERSDIAIVGCSYKSFSDDGKLISKKQMVRYCNLWKKLGRTYFILHPTVMFRSSIFSKLKGFDGTTRIAADTDFFIRASYFYKIRNIKKYLYNKMEHGRSLSNCKETGYGSPLRERYAQNIKKLEFKRKKARTKSALLDLIKPPVNNIEFKLIPVRLNRK